jgi:hypothetical protein
MDEIEQPEQMRFSLSETKEGMISEIIQLLPELKINWIIKRDDRNKRYFCSTIGNVYVEIFETYAEFTLKYKTIKETTKRYQTFIKTPNGGKKAKKLNIYKRISERIDDDEEHVFYKRVLRSVNSQLNSQKEKNELTFTEESQRDN